MKLDIKKTIKEMTLEEKVSMLSGKNFWNTTSIDRLNIPSIMLTDGPHGIRKQGGKADHLGLNKSIPSTCFPTAATIANSWDIDMINKMGELLGKEAAALDVNVLLGPGLNIKRNPLCGRNFEYFSEDPYLSGKLASHMIQGIQKNPVSACPKHFAVNSQEHLRMSINEIVDERALHEIYLEGFRIAVQEGKPKTIMTSYNKINGVYANENAHLLCDILRDKWGYNGLVVTDWGGNNDRVEGLKVGSDLEMPSTGGITNKEVLKAIDEHKIDEKLVDRSVHRLLNLVNETKLNKADQVIFDIEKHHEEAVNIAAHSMVLLKNTDHILPLDFTKKIGIIGDFAKHPRYQGAGSSLVKPTKMSNFIDAALHSKLNVIGYEQGYKRFGGKSKRLMNKAQILAQKSDVIILFLGLDEASEAEGIDRSHLHINKNQIDLISAIKDVNTNIIIVLSGGSPIEMPFYEHAKAILHSYLSGQGGGEAILKILIGEINPSGKLAETYPLKLEDILSSQYYPGQEVSAEHRESIYVGYRYLDKVNKEVLFPFGFGLSYTTFAYSDLSFSYPKVSFKITNTGKYPGHEIAQLYVSHQNSTIFKPVQELKGFVKVYLKENESKIVTIELDEHAFAYYHQTLNEWVVDKGQYQISVGASSRDIRLSQQITVGEQTYPNPYENLDIHDYIYVKDSISDQAFISLLGKIPPTQTWDRSKGLTMNDVVAQLKYQNWFGRSIYKFLKLINRLLIFIGNPIAGNNVFFIINMRFRQIPRFTSGKIKEKTIKWWLKHLKKRIRL